MNRDFEMKGTAELVNYLSALPANLVKGAIRGGLTAAAAPVRDDARARSAKKSGALARGIRTGSPRQNHDGTFSIKISCTGPHGFLGTFLEYGVAPHFISPGDSGLSARKLTQKAGREGMSETGHGALKIGNSFVTGTVHHPGFAPHPFMRPALDAKAEEAIDAFGAKVRDYIEGKTGFIVPVDEAA